MDRTEFFGFLDSRLISDTASFRYSAVKLTAISFVMNTFPVVMKYVIEINSWDDRLTFYTNVKRVEHKRNFASLYLKLAVIASAISDLSLGLPLIMRFHKHFLQHFFTVAFGKVLVVIINFTATLEVSEPKSSFRKSPIFGAII